MVEEISLRERCRRSMLDALDYKPLAYDEMFGVEEHLIAMSLINLGVACVRNHKSGVRLLVAVNAKAKAA